MSPVRRRRSASQSSSTARVLSSTNPTGGVGAWIYSGGSGVPPPKLACPDPSLCVAGAGPGTIYATTSPTSRGALGPGDGRRRPSDRQPGLPDDHAVPRRGRWRQHHHEHEPGWGSCGLDGRQRRWQARSSKVSPARRCCCASLPMGPSACSSRPTPQAPSGRRFPFPGYDAFTSLACPSSSSCVAVDGFGSHVVTSSRPAGSWSAQAGNARHRRGSADLASGVRVTLAVPCAGHGHGSARRLGCHRDAVCVQPGWWSALVQTPEHPRCGASRSDLKRFRVFGVRSAPRSTSAATCSAPRDPARAASWKRNRSARRWFAASCPTRRLCVALHSDPDQVVSSGEPPTYATATPTGSIDVFAGRARTTVEIDPAGGLTGIDCASKSRCVAVDDGGNVLSTSSPTGGSGAWTRSHVDDWPLAAVRCPSTSLCVAVDRGGRAVVGRR